MQRTFGIDGTFCFEEVFCNINLIDVIMKWESFWLKKTLKQKLIRRTTQPLTFIGNVNIILLIVLSLL